jgi:ADP-heptose:LPS heptosyltransferase
MRIGILNLTRFGDLIQMTPLLSGLRRRHPDAELHLIVKSRFRAVAEMLPEIDRIHEVDGDALARAIADPGSSFLEAFRAARRVVDDLASVSYDTLYNLTHSRASAVLLSLMQANNRVGYAIDREGLRQVHAPWLRHMGTVVRARRLNRINLVDVYLGAAGLLGHGERMRVRVPARASAFAGERLRGAGPLLAVQLGASSDAKTWSVAAYAATLSALRARIPGIRCVLVGVSDERKRADDLRARCPELEIIDLIGATSIPELAGVIAHCELLLTGDTGTMHLAGAVGTRSCAIFVGLGTPWETGAYAEGHVALTSRLACAPCRHDVVCGYPACHDDFPPDYVAELLARLLRDDPLDDLSALPRASLWRTAFDPNGVWDLIPLHRRAPDAEELLAEAYRSAFLESFAAIPVQHQLVMQRISQRFGQGPAAWRDRLPPDLPEQLARMAALAQTAIAQVRELERLGSDLGRLKATADALATCDREIYALARTQPLIAPLGLSLESALESLPESDLDDLLAHSSAAYRELARQTSILNEILGTSTDAASQHGESR